MKRFFTIMISVLLMFSCTGTAFAAVATPDETHGDVTSIEVVNVPKTEYSFTYDTDFDLTEDEWINILDGDYDEAYLTSIFLSSFYFYLELEDAQILATYSDGTSEYINPFDCTATVLDMPVSLEDEDLFRNYTVQVEYMGCTDTYSINLYDDTYGYPGYEEGNYRFISYVEPTQNVYVFEDCVYPGSTLFPGFDGYYFDVDTTGMSVTLLNKTTGELEVYSGDSIYCLPVYVDQLLVNSKKSTNLTTLGAVTANDGEEIPFEFTVKLTFKDISKEITPAYPQNSENDGQNSAGSTPDSVTNDNANNKKSPAVSTNALVGNKAVNTGEVFPATVVLVIVGCLSIVTLFIYRKRKIK